MSVTFITYQDGNLLTKTTKSEYSIKQFPLVCDRLTLTCDLPEHLHNAVINNFKDGKHFPQGGYAYSCKLTQLGMNPAPYVEFGDIEDKLTSAFVQCAPSKSTHKFLRLDFNPAKVDMSNLKFVIDNSFLNFKNIGFDYLFEHGKVTRIDLAIDTLHEAANEFLYHYPKMRRVEVVHTKSGRTEYLGGKYKAGKRIVIYDRIPAIKYSNAKKFKDVYKEPIPAMPILRIEFKLNPKDLLFKDLLQLKNPFSGLQLSLFDKLEKGNDNQWDLFLALARFEGAQATLGRLPKHVQDKYKDRLAKGAVGWWKPEKVWAQYSDVIKQIVDPASNAKNPYLKS